MFVCNKLFNFLWGHLRHTCNPSKTTVPPVLQHLVLSECPIKALRASRGGGQRLRDRPHRCPTAGGAHTPTLALSQPTPRSTLGAARVAAHHSEPPGSHPSTRPTAPDSAQPISSRAATLPVSAPIRRRRLWFGRCPCILRSPSCLELREFLRDAVTTLHPRPPSPPSPPGRNAETLGVGSGPPLRWRSREQTKQGRARRSRRRQSATSAKHTEDWVVKA